MEAKKTQVEKTAVVHETAYVLTLAQGEADFLYKLIGGLTSHSAQDAVCTSDRSSNLSAAECASQLQSLYRALAGVL